MVNKILKDCLVFKINLALHGGETVKSLFFKFPLLTISRLVVQLYFTPIEEKEVNFNVICHVKRKTLPLTLNVKAEGYAMNCLVTCEDSHGQKVKLSPEGLNEISFGEVNH